MPYRSEQHIPEHCEEPMEQDTTKQTPDEQDKVDRETSGEQQLHAGDQAVARVGGIGCYRQSGNICFSHFIYL